MRVVKVELIVDFGLLGWIIRIRKIFCMSIRGVIVVLDFYWYLY